MTDSAWIQVAINACLIGSAWGHLRSGQIRNGKDILSIRRALGLENGSSPAFVRREEWDEYKGGQEAKSELIERRIDSVRSKIR